MPVAPPKPGIITVLQWQHGNTTGEDGHMQTPTAYFSKFAWLAVFLFALTACNSGGGSSVSVTGDVPIAYVKRTVAALGNPTDSIPQGRGDLYIRDKASSSAPETNITAAYTGATGDVSDPEVSYDGNKILFAMRPAGEQRWGIFEYDTKTKLAPRRIACDARDLSNPPIPITGDDVDPAYLPDGRIVFTSNRQVTTWRQMQEQGFTPYKYTDEYERQPATVLHTMNADGTDCKQISFNQSHDRNPTVLTSGQIMYSRWDHVGGRNQFSIFTINPDGTQAFIKYGAHDLDDIYLNPREMPDGRLVSTYMPLSRTREGGSLEIIDAENYSANNMPGGTTSPANQLGVTEGQFQATRLLFGNPVADHEAMRGRGLSPLGRYSTPYPLWDGSNRMLVVYTPSQPIDGTAIAINNTGTGIISTPTKVEGTPQYGIYMFDLDKRQNLPIIQPETGYFYSDPVALQARPTNKIPKVIKDVPVDTSALGAGMGLLDVNTVYDTDRLGRMGDAVLVSGVESIPRSGSGNRANIAAHKTPGTTTYENRVARFFRITKAVPTPGGMSRLALGETEFEMQQIVGYGVIEPDGSIRTKVPANTAINITALDKEGRAFTAHTNWLQAREGEKRFCKGCHSARLGATPGDTTTNAQGALLNIPASYQHPVPPSGSLGTTMADTRSIDIDPSTLDLKPHPVSVDIWTPLYNTHDGSLGNPTPYGSPLSTITIDYSLLTTTPPSIKGAACSASWSPGNVLTGTWSAKDCAYAINYLDHIQPILDKSCNASCHSNSKHDGGLDLSNTGAGEFGRAQSYQRLMLGEPRLDPITSRPVIVVLDNELVVAREPAAVTPGSARSSRLVARLYEQQLMASSLVHLGQATVSRPVCAPGAVDIFTGAANASCQNHKGILNASELRLVNEWIDLGGLYYNDPRKPDGSLRSNVALLDQGKFERCIMPLFGTAAQPGSCASCHQAVNNVNFTASPNNRFVLTGNAEGDFNVTATYVTDVKTPDNSLLLSRPTHNPHPGTFPGDVMPMPVGSVNYIAIKDWISNTLNCP
jgi:hypothetical protein